MNSQNSAGESSWVNQIIPIAPTFGVAHPPKRYLHQSEALFKLEGKTMTANPPVSGIVFLPTGSGKTRIGIEHMGVPATHLKNVSLRYYTRDARITRGIDHEINVAGLVKS